MAEAGPGFRQERIKTLTSTAKGVWLGYLGALAFTGITLLGVEDIDFFGLDKATELPLIGVSVPVTSFFWAGALLLAIVYCYLHVFLEQLWVELGNAPARVNEDGSARQPGDEEKPSSPIAVHVHPWLLSECALILRQKRRGEDPPCIEMSPLGYFGVLASALLGWLAGPVTLFFFWLWSQPAHNAGMTMFIALCFIAGLWAMIESARSLWQKMDQFPVLAHPGLTRQPTGDQRPLRISMVVFGTLLITFSVLRTEYDVRHYAKRMDPLTVPIDLSEVLNPLRVIEKLRPVPAQLAEANLVELPASWKTRETAMKDFFAVWCKRSDTPECTAAVALNENNDFQKEWRERRSTYLRVLEKPILKGVELSFADLRDAHLPGIDLRESVLKRANLERAQLEGSVLTRAMLMQAEFGRAQMQSAYLRYASAQAASFFGAALQGADFYRANLNGTNFSFANLSLTNMAAAQLEEADFTLTNLDRTDFTGARMQRSIFGRTQINGTNFVGAYLAGANFTRARIANAEFDRTNMTDVVLYRAKIESTNFELSQMRGVDFSYAFLTGTRESNTSLDKTGLISADFSGAALRFVDASTASMDSSTNLRNSFGDSTVRLPTGVERPCQWMPEGSKPLSNAEFLGRWRGWLEMSPVDSIVMMQEFDLFEYASIPPENPDCVWSLEGTAERDDLN